MGVLFKKDVGIILVSIFLVILIEAASDRQPGKRFGRRKCSDISEMERTS